MFLRLELGQKQAARSLFPIERKPPSDPPKPGDTHERFPTQQRNPWRDAGAALVFSLNAQAQQDDLGAGTPDSKTLPGIGCLSGHPLAQVSRLGSILSNLNPSPALIYCPITRDIPSGNGTTKIALTRVWVIDNSATEDAICRMSSYYETGGELASVVKAVSPGHNSPTPVLLSFGSLDTSKNGPVVLICNIPGRVGGLGPSSGIVSYTYQEGDSIPQPQ